VRRSRRGRASRGGFPQINVLPFVDVMLVLLVIFMAAAPMLLESLAVELPFTRTVDVVPEDADPVVLTLKKDGALSLDASPVTLAALPGELEKIGALSDKAVYLRADAAAPYGQAVKVMDAVKRAGVARLNLVTEREDGGER